VKFRNKIALMRGKRDLADENILRNVVTGDVPWICGYVVATKTQSFALGLKNHPDSKKAARSASVKVVMFFDCEG